MYVHILYRLMLIKSRLPSKGELNNYCYNTLSVNYNINKLNFQYFNIPYLSSKVQTFLSHNKALLNLSVCKVHAYLFSV